MAVFIRRKALLIEGLRKELGVVVYPEFTKGRFPFTLSVIEVFTLSVIEVNRKLAGNN